MTTTRFAPSPTGHLHLGNIRSCFLNWLLAKSNKGKFILRFDDTDTERSEQVYIDGIKSDLEWLGMEYQESYFQSKRIERYNEEFDKLLRLKLVYLCFETSEELEIKKKLQSKSGKAPIYDRSALELTQLKIDELYNKGLQPYWRFKLSGDIVRWKDLIKGEVEVNLSSQSDPVLKRADGSFLYHFPSVVDDIDMGVTDIIRGEDHLTNTAIHIEIFKALESHVPKFGHNPLMLNDDGTKLSKRNFDSISIKTFREKNYLKESLLAYLHSIGLNHEIVFEDIQNNIFQNFDLSKISQNLPKLDIEKINYFQKIALRSMDLKNLLLKFKTLPNLNIIEAEWNLIKNNIDTLEDIELFIMIIRGEKNEAKASKEFGVIIKDIFSKVDSDLSFEDYISTITNYSKEISKKDIFMNTRLILTRNLNGPSVKELFNFFGIKALVEKANDS
ncbi:MAG: glutamate--tRNA ligase [Proteobacteria bacterium]|nr:glutamate--tRNA ligase [Pseudomonadota bacterium]